MNLESLVPLPHLTHTHHTTHTTQHTTHNTFLCNSGTVTNCGGARMMSRDQPYEVIGARNDTFPQPLSFAWRLNHTLAYLLGGVTFFFGSIQYLPWINNFELGGWLFTIGSAGRDSASVFLS
jgi:hypothetical protein